MHLFKCLRNTVSKISVNLISEEFVCFYSSGVNKSKPGQVFVQKNIDVLQGKKNRGKPDTEHCCQI